MKIVWNKCANEECLNGKDGGVAYIDASKQYSRCYKCNQADKINTQTVTPPIQSATTYQHQDESKANSMALAYAKDLVVAGKIELHDLPKYMAKFKEAILTGNLMIEEPIKS